MKSKTKNMFNFLSTLAVVLAATSFARAEDTTMAPASATQTNTTTMSEAGVKPLQKLELSYFGIYVGPSIGAPGYAGQLNPDPADPNEGKVDEKAWPTVLENQVKLTYNFNESLFVGPVVNFYIFPGVTNNSIMQDSGVRIGSKNLIKSGGFTMKGDIRVLAPLAASTRRKNGGFYPEALLSLNYDIPGSKWSVGLLNFEKYKTYDDAKSGSGHLDFDLYAAPNANWQFSKKLAATLYVEFYPNHTIDGAGSGWGLSQPFDVNPGINWDITETFSINPGLVFYPTNPDLAATSAIVYISDKIL